MVVDLSFPRDNWIVDGGKDTHKSFIRWQGGRDEGEKDGGDESPLHDGGDGRRGEDTIGSAIRTFSFISARIDARPSEGTAHGMTFDRQDID